MSDAVFDTTVVACSNAQLAHVKVGTARQRRFRLVEAAAKGRIRIRYNSRLLTEYEEHIRERRNDIIELFFAVLDSPSAVQVKRSTLSRQHHELAAGQDWPRHDEHLIAAAVDGDDPQLYVTEELLGNCGPRIYRVFRIRVHLV